jgi:hypothetical protein
MPMYVPKGAPKSATDLEQGDILTGILRPEVPQSTALHVRQGPRADPADVAKGEASFALHKLRSLVQLESLQHCLVLSNSCDNFQGKQLLLVPMSPHKFGARIKSDADRWSEIQMLATSGARSGTFYLPGDAGLKLTRSTASFDQAFLVSPSWVEQCIQHRGAQRVAGLSTDGIRHLQWALSFFFSRNPRGDVEWPSDEDLLLKKAFFNANPPRKDFLQVELNELDQELQRRGIVVPPYAPPPAPPPPQALSDISIECPADGCKGPELIKCTPAADGSFVGECQRCLHTARVTCHANLVSLEPRAKQPSIA